MLPPALLAGQPPETTPTAARAARRARGAVAAAGRRRRLGAGRRVPRQRRRLGAALPRRAARPAAGRRTRPRSARPPRCAAGAARPPRSRTSPPSSPAGLPGSPRDGRRRVWCQQLRAPGAADGEHLAARGRAPAGRHASWTRRGAASRPAGRTTRQRRPPRCSRGRCCATTPSQVCPLPTAGPVRPAPARACPRRCTCGRSRWMIASDAEDERPPGTPPTLRPPRAPG